MNHRLNFSLVLKPCMYASFRLAIIGDGVTSIYSVQLSACDMTCLRTAWVRAWP